ncbi:MAG TPA: S8 family peptidase [Microvirga sp.]|nr:S8 family peptidase [Microvirga sp.]
MYEGEDETFSFNLSTGRAQIANGHGQATIIDDERQVPAHTGEILVQFKPGASAAAHKAAAASIGGAIAEKIHTAAMQAAGEGELVRIKIGIGLSLEQAMEIVSKRPGVEFVEPNYILSVQATSDDSYYINGSLWGMYGEATTPANQYGSQAGEAWAGGFTGSTKVAVGVIDSGMDYTHPDLYLNVWINQAEIPTTIKNTLQDYDGDRAYTFRDLNYRGANTQEVLSDGRLRFDYNGNGRVDGRDLLSTTSKRSPWEDGRDSAADKSAYVDDLIGWNFVRNTNDPYDDNDHGTHVAGTIGALESAGATGVVGVNWNVQMVALKFLGASGSGSLSNAIKAIDYFTEAGGDHAGVVDFAATNNSWGGGGYSQALLDAITRGAIGPDLNKVARGDGILFVAAAGNNGSNNDGTAHYPSNYNTTAGAGYDAVISVASIDSNGDLSSFSNWGNNTVDLAAPGRDIWSTVPGGGYASFNGTSMATPHVTGAIALAAAYEGSAFFAESIKADLLASVVKDDGLAPYTVADGRLDIGTMSSYWDLIA